MGETTKEKRNNWFLYSTVLLATLANFTFGTSLVWSSQALPKLMSNNTDINPMGRPITTTEQSLIASLLAVGAMLSPVLAGISTDIIGRKKTLIISVIPLYLSYIVIALANEVWHLFIARLLCGIGIGGVGTVGPNYIAEISEKHNRGAMSCLMLIGDGLGNLLVYAIGPYMSFLHSSIVCLVPPTLFFLGFTLIAPESPYFLVAKEKYDKAEKSMRKLRYKDEQVFQLEMTEVQTAVTNAFADKFTIFDMLKDSSLSKRLLLIVGLTIFQQFCGINVILFYLQTIFEVSGSGVLAPELAAVLIGVVQFISMFCSLATIDRLGRRFLLYLSGVGTLIAMILLGTFFYLKENGTSVADITWIPLFSLILFVVGDSIGFAPVPSTLLGEIFPQQMRAIASTTSTCLNFMLTFITTLFFPYLLEYIGAAKSFWCFGVFCAASIIFTALCVPETKGKSLNEIQEMYNKQRQS